MLERLLSVLALRDVAPGKPVWLVGLSFARDTRRFVEGTVQQVK